MTEKAGAQISRKAFSQSLAILLALMIIAGVATRVVPAAAMKGCWSTGARWSIRLVQPNWQAGLPRLAMVHGPD
jgi:hypothetical protein